MKHPLTFSFAAIAAAAGLFISCYPPATDATATFEANSTTIAQVFADFEAESDDFFTHFNADAVWRGTGLNAPDTVTLEQVTAKYKAAWAKYDYELISPTISCPASTPKRRLSTARCAGILNGTSAKQLPIRRKQSPCA